MSNITVKRKESVDLKKWRWTTTIRPPQHERITVEGETFTKAGAYRTARRELRRLLWATRPIEPLCCGHHEKDSQ